MLTIAAFNRVNMVILSYWLRPLRARVREFQTLFRPIFKVLFPHILDCLLKAMTESLGMRFYELVCDAKQSTPCSS